jgi:hypothetical protein
MCRRGDGFRAPQCPFPAVEVETPAPAQAVDALHPWRLGGPLDHPRHGRGTGLAVDGKHLTAAFPRGGTKTFDIATLRAALGLAPTIYG